jgi:hypothetical protein
VGDRFSRVVKPLTFLDLSSKEMERGFKAPTSLSQLDIAIASG